MVGHRARRLVFAAICIVTMGLSGSVAGQETAPRGLGRADDVNACENCHDEPKVVSVLHTAHGLAGDARTGIAAQGCQSCHGDSAAHMARPGPDGVRPPPEFVFSGANASPTDSLNAVCSGCHQGGSTQHWAGSLHDTSQLACSSCHASHPARDPVLIAETQAPVCFSCHAEQRAAMLRLSHHPVGEGRMACSDCHQPHGSDAPTMLRQMTVNDTCLNCHDEKRGPFLWEHAPVQEQCTVCHTPHGSVQVSLLRQRVPYLCQTCHDSTLHNSQPFSGASLPGGTAPARQMVLKACLNCHGQIHGSNHPSGIRFAR
ncbi:MAG: DmsE family decaheme c-type cytochrome [Rhodospirillaceae bacterium]|nr:DmsE family decaheme c-type cytochrome [Rhodospirillaceae bacterium]